MVQCVHYGGVIRAQNVRTQVGRRSVDEVTPSSTNMRQFAPPKSVIPTMNITKLAAVEDFQEYIILQHIDSRV